LTETQQVLIARVRSLRCALALTDVVEVMRPLPVARLEGLPTFVLGAAMIRGAAVPVIDLGAILVGPEGARPTRFLTIRSGARIAALAIEEIIGVRTIARTELRQLELRLTRAQ
jgi:purine-binding chemotaxis protein CheW